MVSFFSVTASRLWQRRLIVFPLGFILWHGLIPIVRADNPLAPEIDETVECDLFVVGGGLAGAAATYEGLLAGKTVCMTEITDWVGGQISSQGTSALDERPTQAELLYYPRGYLEFRNQIQKIYSSENPGDCWVSKSCFLPKDGHRVLMEALKEAEQEGKGTLKWFPNTVVKSLDINNQNNGQLITGAIAIEHQPALGAAPLNTYPLSQTIEDSYRYEDSEQFTKRIIHFKPKAGNQQHPTPWYVIEATETGEVIALADVPYRLGIDPRSYLEPSSSSVAADPYCTQGFTFTFAMEKTAKPQPQSKPVFYSQYRPYYSYEKSSFANTDLLFTYRQIWSPKEGEPTQFGGINFERPQPGNISMQNWTWGNDYRPGTDQDNLIYTHDQLESLGQLEPGGWLGGLRTQTLKKGEEHALGFYYWFVKGRSDSRLGSGVKQPDPNNRYLQGLDSPMGTVHGLSKYPYMREARRIIGRPSFYYPDGFLITEIDISRRNYQDEYYRQTLSPNEYRRLHAMLAGLEGFEILDGDVAPEKVDRRKRSTIYPDSVGIGYYPIDFHPCMSQSPPEAKGNTEKEGERQGAGLSYPFQIPLRAMLPQNIDNLIVSGKSIAVSHIAAAAYRVHAYEWSSGAAAGTVAVFAQDHQLLPYELVEEPLNPDLQVLRRLLEENGNPTAFPDTSIFNNTWDSWN